jgi:hypothetical protein
MAEAASQPSNFALGDLPVIELDRFLNGDDSSEDCKTIVDCLHKYGILLIKDPVSLVLLRNGKY